MSTRPRTRLAAATALLALALGACAGDDGTDLGTDLGAEPAGDQSLEEQGITSSCLAGDEDCVDESNGGGDVTRPILLADQPSDAPAIERGPTAGATGRIISNAYLVDETTLQLTFDAGSCDRVEDVLVTESETEVRVMVLSAQSTDVETCAAVIQPWSIEVTLDAPLGDRELLDLAG